MVIAVYLYLNQGLMVELHQKNCLVLELHDLSAYQIIFLRDSWFTLIIHWILATNKGGGHFIEAHNSPKIISEYIKLYLNAPITKKLLKLFNPVIYKDKDLCPVMQSSMFLH